LSESPSGSRLQHPRWRLDADSIAGPFSELNLVEVAGGVVVDEDQGRCEDLLTGQWITMRSDDRSKLLFAAGGRWRRKSSRSISAVAAAARSK